MKLYRIIPFFILTLYQQGVTGLEKKRVNYYCERCGQRYGNVTTLTVGNCPRHPEGAYKGKHKLYEGTEKAKYTCKNCGQQYSSIQTLTSANCYIHPDGAYKGKHAPAL